MAQREYKVGDRVRTSFNNIWERCDGFWICVQSSGETTIKYGGRASGLVGITEYLGNYLKADKFSELYDLLNN